MIRNAMSLLFISLVTLVSAGDTKELVVSQNGLSPAEAIECIRKSKIEGDQSAWTVRVKKGVYNIKKPLVFTPADSGSKDFPVKWIGDNGAVFSGGGKIENWRDDGDGVWSAPIPVNEKGEKIFFESLYVNGRRADRSRFPGKGDLKFGKWAERKEISGAVTNYIEEFTVQGPQPDFLASLSREELDAVQCRIAVKWSYCVYPVESYTPSNGKISLCGKESIAPWKKWDSSRHNYLFFENVAVGFTEPGQWFYDVKAGRVKYRPFKGETLESLEAIAPTSRLVSLVEFKGDLDKGDFVHDITFENIAFTASRTDGEVVRNGAVKQYQLQAARQTGATIYAIGAHRVKFDGCRVFNTENYAFKFDDGCVSNTVTSCEIYDAGSGGIWLGNNQPNLLKSANENWRDLRDPWKYPFPTKSIVDTSVKAVRFNVIDNNLITHCGRVNPEGCGIVLTHAADTKVTHNEISDIFYTGISVGWTWGYWGSYAQRNEISFNLIKNIGQGKMADMGGVYTLGASFGTVVTNNVIMDVKSSSYGGWGMYNDEGSEGVLWENNLVVNTSADSYHLHFGRNNKVVNCVMINGGTSKLCVSRIEKHDQITFSNNIVYWPSGPLYVKSQHHRNALQEGVAKVKWNNNFFWCANGITQLNGPMTGIVADPGFVDPNNGNWRLKSDSPVVKLGFKPWDYSLSGRRNADKDRVAAKFELQAIPPAANMLTNEEKADGYELLFDGVNLPSDKWVGVATKLSAFPSNGWCVIDGTLSMHPIFKVNDDGSWSDLPAEDKKNGSGGDIVTKKKYRDFIFKFDFRMTLRANSGVKYFYDENLNRGTCEEYQILEKGHPDYNKGRDGNRKVAALYDLKSAPLAETLVKPAGRWNSGMIVSKGANVEHWLNGVKVLEYNRASKEFREAVAKSKYAAWGKDLNGMSQPWGELSEGRILLQDHKDSLVSFCNLRIKELK